jgi:hypothetical protein
MADFAKKFLLEIDLLLAIIPSFQLQTPAHCLYFQWIHKRQYPGLTVEVAWLHGSPVSYQCREYRKIYQTPAGGIPISITALFSFVVETTNPVPVFQCTDCQDLCRLL